MTSVVIKRGLALTRAGHVRCCEVNRLFLVVFGVVCPFGGASMLPA